MLGGELPGVKKPDVACGNVGNPCETPEEYPVCDPPKVEDGWAGLAQMVIWDDPKSKRPKLSFVKGTEIPKGYRAPSSEEEGKKQDEIRKILSSDYLEKFGLAGVCRSETRPYRWFGYQAKLGMPGFLALLNEQPYDVTRWDQTDIPLSFEEMMGLASCKELALGRDDVSIKVGFGPKAEGKRKMGPGLYHFTNNVNRLAQIIKVLQDPNIKIEGLSAERRKEITGMIAGIKEIHELQKQAITAQLDQLWKMLGGQFLMQMVLTVPMLLIFRKTLQQQTKSIEIAERSLGMQAELFKQQSELMELNRAALSGDSDKNKLERFTWNEAERQTELLKKNILTEEIEGRDQEAIEYLEAWAQPKRANPLLLAPSGVGKDKVHERACQLIVLRDPRIPEQFLDGTLKAPLTIDPSSLGAGTGIRGDAEARAAAIDRAMQEGHPVYGPEAAGLSKQGAARDSVDFGELLKTIMTKPYSKLSGSTTPDSYQDAILDVATKVDLERRWSVLPELGDLPIQQIRQILLAKSVPLYEKHYKIKISEDAVDAAIHLGLTYVLRPGKHDRMDVIDTTVLQDAVKMVTREQGRGATVTRGSVAKIVALRVRKVIDANAIYKDTVVYDAAKAAKEISYGRKWMAELERDPWFKALSHEQKVEGLGIVLELISRDHEKYSQVELTPRGRERSLRLDAAVAGINEGFRNRGIDQLMLRIQAAKPEGWKDMDSEKQRSLAEEIMERPDFGELIENGSLSDKGKELVASTLARSGSAARPARPARPAEPVDPAEESRPAKRGWRERGRDLLKKMHIGK
jgi:hypothetical protein